MYLKLTITAQLKVNMLQKGIKIKLFNLHLMITKLLMIIFIKHRSLMSVKKLRLQINIKNKSKGIQ